MEKNRIANPISPVRLRVAPPETSPCQLLAARVTARVVKLVDTSDLKSAAFLQKGRTGSIPVPGTSR